MSLTYGLETARDLFDKLIRDADALEQEVTSDKLWNFVITAYHLRDWVEKDPTISRQARKELCARIRKALPMRIARDLANASKHFQITQYTPDTDEASSRNGYGCGRYGYGAYGDGEEQITITLDDGRSFDALWLKNEIVSLWDGFFKRHGI